MPGSMDADEPTGNGAGGGALPVPVVRLDPDLPLPAYAKDGDAGADLLARDDVTLEAGADGPPSPRESPWPSRWATPGSSSRGAGWPCATG